MTYLYLWRKYNTSQFALNVIDNENNLDIFQTDESYLKSAGNGMKKDELWTKYL
jgi:hypothetical protein